MVKIRNLTKTYKTTSVFCNFSLDIKKGEITCILGESGSGKTTLLNVLAGLTSYDGQVDKEQCSYVFQKPNLFPNLTVRNNLLLINSSVSEVEEIAKDLGVYDKLDSYPKHLSGGQAQRVALARALLYKKEILLLDEPFTGLDLGLKYQLLDKIKRVNVQTGNTVLMVTHDIKEAVSIADRVVVLKDGEIIFDCSNVTKKTEEQIFDLLLEKYKEKVNLSR